MSRAVVAFISALLVLSWLMVTPVDARASSLAFVDGQVIVRIDALSGATIGDIDTAYGTSVIASLPDDPLTFLLTVPAGATTASTLQAMEADTRLELSEPNFDADAQEEWAWGGFDPTPYLSAWALAALDVAPAFATTTGAGVTVAVIDTGAQIDHPSLAGAVVSGYDFVVDAPGGGEVGVGPEVGHGTHVAGLIHLVAPSARILPLRVLGPDGHGTSFGVARAVQYALRQNASVINLSLGSAARSLTVHNVLRQATLQGAIVVAASGNLSSSVAQYPAADQCAISVGSVGPTGKLSTFSNYGKTLDLVAPGEGITSTFPTNGFASGSGTSMSTAFVSGQAALIKSIAPARNALDIGMLIAITATTLDGVNPAFAGQIGAGRPDVARSVTAASASVWPKSGPSVISSSCVAGG